MRSFKEDLDWSGRWKIAEKQPVRISGKGNSHFLPGTFLQTQFSNWTTEALQGCAVALGLQDAFLYLDCNSADHAQSQLESCRCYFPAVRLLRTSVSHIVKEHHNRIHLIGLLVVYRYEKKKMCRQEPGTCVHSYHHCHHCIIIRISTSSDEALAVEEASAQMNL